MRTSRYSAGLITRVSVSIDIGDRTEALKELKLRKFAVISESTDANGQHTIVAERAIGTWHGDDYLLNDHVAEHDNIRKEFDVLHDNTKTLGSVLNIPL